MIAPGYQEKVYRLYLRYVFQRPDVATRIKPVELNGFVRKEICGECFLIVIQNLSEQQISQLLQMGFLPLRISTTWLGHSLFVYNE